MMFYSNISVGILHCDKAVAVRQNLPNHQNKPIENRFFAESTKIFHVAQKGCVPGCELCTRNKKTVVVQQAYFDEIRYLCFGSACYLLHCFCSLIYRFKVLAVEYGILRYMNRDSFRAFAWEAESGRSFGSRELPVAIRCKDKCRFACRSTFYITHRKQA